MPRSAMTWLLCILLGISVALPGVVMAAGHHAGDPCIVESASDLALVSPVLETTDEQGGLTICSAFCGHCDAVMLDTQPLSTVSLPTGLVPGAVWPLTLLERLDRPPRA